MTEDTSAAGLLQSEGLVLDPTPVTLRIAVLDRDSGFLQVLDKRLERLGWERRVLASSVSPETIVPMMPAITNSIAGSATATSMRSWRSRSAS